MDIKRGDIFYIESYYSTGSEQQAGRPAVVVSNDANNRFSRTVEVVYLTTQPKNDMPTHVTIRSAPKESTALCEGIHTVSVERVASYCGHVTDTEMMNLEIAMMISLGLDMNNSGARADASWKVSAVQPAPAALPAGGDPDARTELAAMTAKYEMLRGMYDALLASALRVVKT